jgi:hypothetical protein
MHDWARENLSPGQVFSKSAPVAWFRQHYPKIKSTTVGMHVEGMGINNRNRKHHANIRPGSEHDLFYKLGPDSFRLWNPEDDGRPVYKQELEDQAGLDGELQEDEIDQREEAAREFAFERDLRNYLVKNLNLIEPGLRVYEEEEISGVEFPVGGRFIDILAVDKQGGYLVIELKVSRGYDRVLGQLLRYMAWVQQNMAPTKAVRGAIVANEVTADLRLAASLVPTVKLIEYEISFKLRPI